MKDELADLRELNLPFNVDEVTSQCHECVRNQIKKYEKQVDGEGKVVGNRFLVPCKGIIKELVSPMEAATKTDEQLEILKAVRSKVEFAEKFARLPGDTPWIARWYQKQVLDCTSLRKVLRIGRRSGKTDSVCIEILYKIFTNNNRRVFVTGPQKIHVEEIFTRIRAFIAANPALQDSILRDRSAPIYELELRNGSRVRGVPGGAKGKKEGLAGRGQDADDIYCFPKGTLVNTSKFSVKPIETLTLQDTVLGGNQKNIFVGDIQNLGVRKGTLVTIPTALNTIKCTPDHPLFNGEEDVSAKEATEVIVSLYHKELTFGYEAVVARLLGFLYGDGWISNKTVGFSGQPDDLEQIQIDLMSLGDKRHTISARETENTSKGIKGFGAQISSSYIYPFFKDLHPIGKKVFQSLRVPKMIMEGKPYLKTAFLSGLFSAEGTGVKYQKNKRTPRTIELNMRSQQEEWIKNWFNDVCSLLDEIGIKYSFKTRQLEEEDRFVGYLSVSNSKENIDLFVEKIGFCYCAEKTRSANIWKLFRHYEKTWGSYSWIKNRQVKSFEGSSVQASLALTLPRSTVKYHYKLYNDLYSEDLMTPDEYITKLTWKDGYVLLPIFKENVRFSSELVDVYNLTSGASNRFFAGGLFTHNCEEMDYIDETALRGGILPILYTTPTTSLVGFSTPSGFKTPFYTLCEDSPRYKEFHFTYKVLPWWKTIEAEKGQFTEEDWQHEYEAEWGTAESGVYKPSYIDRALTNYEYGTMTRNPVWKYTIGTDWNEKYGTEIVVLGYNPFTQMFQVVETDHVERSEFTQLAGVSKLLTLNRKWRPHFIYIDAGNGSTNYELLRKTAYDNSRRDGDRDTANLLRILRKYDAGASIEVRDPVSSQKKKAPAKPFMVNASVRLFEQNKIRLSVHDHTLEKQLRNYIIERITPTKNPVYGLEDEKVKDHRLDALNLAIVAFQLEFDSLHVQNVSTEVAAVPDPRTLKDQRTRTKEESEERISVPQERRLDGGFKKTTVEEQVFANMPARVDSELNGIRTNRPGWSTDEENLHIQKFLHRRRGRQAIRRERPTRTNI
jgi:hypothetical protein